MDSNRKIRVSGAEKSEAELESLCYMKSITKKRSNMHVDAL